MIVVALIAGFLLGGIPTADWLAGRRGIDLRASGSGNPGANNASRLGGAGLGAGVLAVELLKGSLAAVTGWSMAGDPGMAVAGVGAVLGNVHNPYRRLAGGQGLGIAAGAAIAALPLAAGAAITAIIAAVRLTRSSSAAALVALAAFVATAALAPYSPWGIESLRWRLVFAVGVAGVILPKQIRRTLTARDHR